ncbi:MAG: response regulator [Pseudomonadota bacterium]
MAKKQERTVSYARDDQQPVATRLAILLIATAASATVLFVFRSQLDEVFVLALLGILALVGVFYLTASVLGLIGLRSRDHTAEYAGRFLDSLSDGVCITDKNGVLSYANAAYMTVTGASTSVDLRTPEQVLSLHDDAANAVYRLANTDVNAAPLREEFRLPGNIAETANEPHWYRVTVTSVPGADTGSMKSWRITDITADREQQELYFLELQKAIDHLDRAPVGFFASDEYGKLQYINATLADWLDIDLAGFVPGRTSLDDILVGESLELVRNIRAQPGTRRTASVDAILAKTNGESFAAQLVHTVEGAGDEISGPARTIVIGLGGATEGVRDLRDAELRFTRFFNSTPMAIAALDTDGRILRTNTSFANLFGAVLEPDAIERRVKFSEIIHERTRDAFGLAFDAACRDQAKIEPLDTVVELEGEERHIRIFVNAVTSPKVLSQDDNGEVIDEDLTAREEAAIVYAMDTTEQKALENQMAQSQKMQAVGQLAGGIAHDFNNVLTAIIMASDLLLTTHTPSDPSFGDIMNIKQNANRAASLVRQLLAFSRRQTMRPEVLSLTDVLADLRMLLSRLIGNEIELTMEHDRDLWPVKADLGQFEQVIVNLTVNARDAMPEGGSLRIRTENIEAANAAALGLPGMPDGDFAVVHVTDTGTGIEPQVLDQIFEPFFTTKEVGKGTGLGLSMVYGIVKQTGGSIYADSVVGEGTTFSIYLPRHIPSELNAVDNSVEAEDAVALTQTATPRLAKEKARDLSGNATILLVEDEDAVRMGGVRALTSRGYTVHEAADGMDAMDIMEDKGAEIDLIVSDVVMPEMDGPSLLREVRKEFPDVKFIFVSGYAEDAFAKNLPEGAQFGFLPKPFSLKQLATKVKETLEAD